MKDYKEWPGALAAILLILAIFSWPYGYYVFLRWAISAIAVYVAYSLSEAKDNKLWIFVGILILFNPIAPIYMERSLWIVADLISAGLFLAYSKAEVVAPKVKVKIKSKTLPPPDELEDWDSIKKRRQ